MSTVLALGTRLGRFEIVRPLGRGGAGAVYLARAPGPEGFERLFALKVLHPVAGARTALIGEAKRLQGLHHSNVVQIFELGREGAMDFVAMEYVDGLSLDDVIVRTSAEGSRLGPALCLYVAAEICKALHFVHGRLDAAGRPLGLVHRDVSPSNILISRSGEVKLADFGIAKGASGSGRETDPGIVKGKLGYMPPEQASGGVALDGRANLFALGVSTYEALTGLNPLLGGDDTESYRRALDPAFPPPSNAVTVAPEIDALFAKALAAGRENRFEAAAAMRRAIEACEVLRTTATPDLALATEVDRLIALGLPKERSLASAARAALGARPVTVETVSTTPAPMTTMVIRQAPRSRAVWAALVALAAVVASAGVWAVTRSGGVETPVRPPVATASPALPPPPTTPPPPLTPEPSAVASPAALPSPRVRPKTGSAILRVNVDPWAEVLVDGRSVGNVPRQVTLGAGRHTLTLRNPGLKLEKTLVLSLVAGETRTVSEWPP